jgi:hypothetical protein
VLIKKRERERERERESGSLPDAGSNPAVVVEDCCCCCCAKVVEALRAAAEDADDGLEFSPCITKQRNILVCTLNVIYVRTGKKTNQGKKQTPPWP